MLNIYRRHRERGRRNCPSKPKCSIHFEGIDGSGVRDWNRAIELIREMELPIPLVPTQKPQTPISTAVNAFLELKAKKNPETIRKYRNLLKRLEAFALGTLHKSAVDELTYPEINTFKNTWLGANSTQRNAQTMLKAFFTFCVDADYLAKSPVRKLDAIPEDREKTDPFEPEEMERIFAALPMMADEYGRRGGPIAKQTKAFVYVMRYTGMSIASCDNRRVVRI